jgi:DNA helicase-2/ATP-dependent DNA helicase PcrA
MERCYMTHARQRFRNGQTMFSNPSRFLKDIDSCYIQQTQLIAGNSPSTRVTKMPSFSVNTTASSKLVSISQKSGAVGSRTRKEVRSEWKKNDRVEHKVFGVGVVLDVYRENDNDKIDILFDNVGKKTLLLTYAKLTRI